MTSSVHRRGSMLLAALFGMSVLATHAHDKGMYADSKAMPIIDAQKKEIGQLEMWLAKSGK